MATNNSIANSLEGAPSRPVLITTTPVKVKGIIAAFTFNALRIVFRSNLVWSTHWTIRVGTDNFFEAQRIPQQPQPVLRYPPSQLVSWM